MLGSRKCGSLDKIEVSIESNWEIIGREILCETEEFHKAIIEKIRHLEQAKKTPFGQGEGYDHLHGLRWWKNTKNINDGKSMFYSDFEEINKWVAELKKAYKTVKLKKEAEIISSPITVA